MQDPLSFVELGALSYVAEVRLREARDVKTLAGQGPLAAPAQAYLESVERLFKAIREQDRIKTANAQECRGTARPV